MSGNAVVARLSRAIPRHFGGGEDGGSEMIVGTVAVVGALLGLFVGLAVEVLGDVRRARRAREARERAAIRRAARGAF